MILSRVQNIPLPYAFRYFDQPGRYAAIMMELWTCAACGEEKPCFYMGNDEQEEEADPIGCCFDCAFLGRMSTMNRIRAEREELQAQLRLAAPDWSAEQIQDHEQKLTRLLIGTTPPLPVAQEIKWPIHCGDYARFIQFAGRTDYRALDLDKGGRALFVSSFAPKTGLEQQFAASAWSQLLDGPLPGNTPDSLMHSPAALLFQCVACGSYATRLDLD